MANMQGLSFRQFLDDIVPQLLEQVVDEENRKAGIKDIRVYWEDKVLRLDVYFNDVVIQDTHQGQGEVGDTIDSSSGNVADIESPGT